MKIKYGTKNKINDNCKPVFVDVDNIKDAWAALEREVAGKGFDIKNYYALDWEEIGNASRGGKRKGAGRPTGSIVKPPSKTVAVRLPVEVIEQHGIDGEWLKDAVEKKLLNKPTNPELVDALRMSASGSYLGEQI